MPLAYRSYYRDTSDYLYRHDGNAIYRVNSNNMMVDGIAALDHRRRRRPGRSRRWR